MPNSLLLHSPHHNPAYKVTLQKRVYQQDRQGADENLRCPDGTLGQVRDRLRVHLGHVALHDDRLHKRRQRQLLRITDVDDPVEICIPVSHHHEQRHGSNNRHGHGQINFDKRLEMTCAIDKCGLLQVLRHRAEEIQQQNDVEHRHQTWQDQRPQRIHQTQFQNEDVSWNQAPTEQHRDDKIPQVNIPSAEHSRLLRQSIRRKRIDDECKPGAQHRPLHRYPERGQEVGVIKRLGVRLERKSNWPECHEPCIRRGGRTEGYHQQVIQRQQAEHRKDGQKHIVEDTENAIR